MSTGNIFRHLLFVLIIFNSTSCQTDDTPDIQTTYGIFEVIDTRTVKMSGEINSSTLDDFNNLISDKADVNRILVEEISGSTDDAINLLVSKKIYDRNTSTHLLENGSIASGGVDFFLAGTTRTKGDNTKIGVHSWSDGANEATDFPVGHANHQPYIDYYISIGFTESDAEAFYYFTINAAPADSIHWMTNAEIEQYGILKP